MYIWLEYVSKILQKLRMMELLTSNCVEQLLRKINKGRRYQYVRNLQNGALLLTVCEGKHEKNLLK